jgi:small-conductance mechanosensitive channel/CRP-like cAMP-binding protein
MYAYVSWFLPAAILCSLILWITRAATLRQLRYIWVYCGLSLVLWIAFPASGGGAGPQASLAFAELAGVMIVVVTLEFAILRRIHAPRFVTEILITGGYLLVIFSLMRHTGFNVTGMITTSAVATAVIGLALQDMLANLVGGIVLEMEQSIKVGDWIHTDQFTGQVTAVRLRHSVIRTADSDVVLMPNSSLIRQPVTLVSRKHRKLIPFRLAYGCNPALVTREVTGALRASPLNGVSAEPAPRCILVDLNPQYVEFGIFAWLNTPGKDYLAISAVLTRVHFALARLGIPMTAITQVVEVQRGAAANRGQEEIVSEHARVLESAPLFRAVPAEGIERLAESSRYLEYAPGEHIIRQGDETGSMFVLLSGSADIHVEAASGVAEYMATLDKPGQIFGEISLLTGESRSASVIAMDAIECLEINKESMLDLLTRHPELARDMCAVMAARQAELAVAREKLDTEHRRQLEAQSQLDLLQRIQRYFGIAAQSRA